MGRESDRQGKTVLDIGLDAMRNQRSKFYAAEIQTLLKHGYKQVKIGAIEIKRESYTVYQWVRN